MCALTFLPNKESGSTHVRRRASNPVTANNLGFYAYKYIQIHTYIHTFMFEDYILKWSGGQQ